MIAIPASLPQYEEIVDLTQDAQQRERRRQRGREASARWRQNHPDDYHAAQKRWRDKDPEATREAGRRNMRAYRARKKQQSPTPLESA